MSNWELFLVKNNSQRKKFRKRIKNSAKTLFQRKWLLNYQTINKGNNCFTTTLPCDSVLSMKTMSLLCWMKGRSMRCSASWVPWLRAKRINERRRKMVWGIMPEEGDCRYQTLFSWWSARRTMSATNQSRRFRECSRA